MQRKSRYADKVMAYVLAQRGKGAKWKEIIEGVKQEFNMTPPSERQMRTWFEKFSGNATDPERRLKENLIQVVRDSTPLAAFTGQKLLVQQVPKLVEAWQRGDDPWIAGGMMILSQLEETVGSDLFDDIIARYQQTREARKEKLTGLKGQPETT